jgi:hypothetical protein
MEAGARSRTKFDRIEIEKRDAAIAKNKWAARVKEQMEQKESRLRKIGLRFKRALGGDEHSIAPEAEPTRPLFGGSLFLLSRRLLCWFGGWRHYIGLVFFYGGAVFLRRLPALPFLMLFGAALIARERSVLARFDAAQRRLASFKIFVFPLVPAVERFIFEAMPLGHVELGIFFTASPIRCAKPAPG